MAVWLTPTGALSAGAAAVPVVLPNVRAKRATTAGRQARAGENVPRTAYRQTGPGGLPLALRLSEGLGVTRVLPFNQARGGT